MSRKYWWLMSLYTLSSFIQAFPMVSVLSSLTQSLKLPASDVAFYYTVIFIPWNFRAVYGLISDAIPLFGCRRRPYLVTSYLLVCVMQVMYGQLVHSLAASYMLGVSLSLFFAFSEAVLDAVSVDLVRASQSEPDGETNLIKKSTDIQSLNMTFRTVGTILALIAAGGLSTELPPRVIISMSAIFPLMSAIICMFAPLEQNFGCIGKKNFVTYICECVRVRRLSGKPVLIPAVFILLYASLPTSSVPFMTYMYQNLGFSNSELHAVAQCASLGGLAGTVLYWRAFRNSTDIRTGFFVSICVSALTACTRLLIIHGWTSIYFVCADEILINAASRLPLMSVQVIASLVASSPEHSMYEGFVFGLFASVEAWGGTVSGLLSAILSAQVSLVNLVAITAGLGLLPLLGLKALSENVKTDDETVESSQIIDSL